MNPLEILLVHAAATWGLVGLIWTVQLVQYPGFALVGAVDLRRFHGHHCTRITWIVGPLMACELLTGLALYWNRPEGLPSVALAWGLGSIAVNWACTAFLAVPLHRRVGRQDRLAQRALVAVNWIRTVTWSARGLWTILALRAVVGSP